MSSDLLIELLQALDAPQHKFAIYGRYYRGENQSLGFVSPPESQAAIGHRLSSMVVNIPRVLVNALAERCRIFLGFFDPDETIWRDFIANDLDQQAGIVHRSALLYGQSFVIVWGGDGNRPIATVESPLNVQVLTDPATGVITSAVKRYTTKHESHAYVYLPTEVQHWRAKAVGAASSAYELVEKLPHHMGMVPVVRFLNADLIGGDGVSEISDIMKPSDGLSKKISTDMLVGSEFYAKPRRVLTGVEMVEVAKRDEKNGGDPRSR